MDDWERLLPAPFKQSCRPVNDLTRARLKVRPPQKIVLQVDEQESRLHPRPAGLAGDFDEGFGDHLAHLPGSHDPIPIVSKVDCSPALFPYPFGRALD